MRRSFFLLFIFGTIFGLQNLAIGQIDEFYMKWHNHIEEKKMIVSDERHLPYAYTHSEKTKYSIVIIHGLFESPHYLNGIGFTLYQRGFNVISVLLPGHWESDLKSIDRVHPLDWKNEVEKNIEMASFLGEKVILLGHSTGGLLALEPVVNEDPRIAGLVLFCPALKLLKRVQWAANLGRMLNIDGNKVIRVPPDGYDYAYFSPNAAVLVQRSIERVLGTTKQDVIQSYIKINKPIYLAYAEDDPVLNLKELKDFQLSVSSQITVKYYPKSTGVYHGNILKTKVDTYDFSPDDYNKEAGQLFYEVESFIQGI